MCADFGRLDGQNGPRMNTGGCGSKRFSAFIRGRPRPVLDSGKCRFIIGGALAAGLLLVALLLLRLGGFIGRDAVWARIQETGVWRVGMDPSFPPFENLDVATQQPVGLDVDLARAIAARWGARVEFVGVGFDQLIDAVYAHKVDSALSAMPIFAERSQEVAFSEPYIEAGIVLAVPPGSPVRGPDDLAGRRVAAEWGSAGDAQARILQRGLPDGFSLVLRDTVTAALDAVAAGEADVALADAISLALHGGGLEPVAVVDSDPYVIVLPRNAPDLRRAVNEALAALAADGTLAAIEARWLKPGE